MAQKNCSSHFDPTCLQLPDHQLQHWFLLFQHYFNQHMQTNVLSSPSWSYYSQWQPLTFTTVLVCLWNALPGSPYPYMSYRSALPGSVYLYDSNTPEFCLTIQSKSQGIIHQLQSLLYLSASFALTTRDACTNIFCGVLLLYTQFSWVYTMKFMGPWKAWLFINEYFVGCFFEIRQLTYYFHFFLLIFWKMGKEVLKYLSSHQCTKYSL